MTTKIQTSIYRIDEALATFEELDSFIVKKKYVRQSLRSTTKNGFNLFLYYQKKKSDPKWKDFFRQIASSNQDVLKKNCNNEGFVFLLVKEDTGIIYALTGGLGYFAIQDFIEPEFGLSILARIIDKNSKVIKSARENSVLGGIQGAILFFRKEYNLSENDEFGKIYQELKAGISQKTLVEKFGFDFENLKSIPVCLAKSSFRLNKQITFEELIKLITGCETILGEAEQGIQINSVTKLVKKRDANVIAQLQEQLEEKIWEKFAGGNQDEKFDLCHREFEKYLTSQIYKIRKDGSEGFLHEWEEEALLNLDQILNLAEIRNTFNTEEEDCKSKLLAFIKKIFIQTFDDEPNYRTKGRLFDHLIAEIECAQKKYFLVNGFWYFISEDFLQSLNQACKDFILSSKADPDLIDRTWNVAGGDQENDFNKSFINDDNTIVLDKILPENIEPCDILKWNGENLYLIHVKAGFAADMRDLCSQILIAATTIQQDIKSGNAYIGKIYDTLQAKMESNDDYFKAAGEQTRNISREDFISLFGKNIVFIIAILDKANTARLIENVDEFDSNIAKFSLIELFKQMKGLDLKLMVHQIGKS